MKLIYSYLLYSRHWDTINMCALVLWIEVDTKHEIPHHFGNSVDFEFVKAQLFENFTESIFNIQVALFTIQ